jgi:flagellar FliL protein
MATKAPAKASTAAPAEGKPKSRLLIIVIALVIVLAGGGAGAWFFMSQKSADHKPAAHEAAKETAAPPVFLALDAFTVNLQPGEGSEQFLQTNLTLQVADQEQAELLKAYMPNVRSRLLLLLSGKKASDILSVEGKNKLTQEILEIFKEPLMPGGPKAKVSNVLYTSFVVQ